MSASEAYALAGLLGAMMIGVISPGPSFIMVAQIALSRSRRDGLFAALGMGLGGLLFGVLALAGLHAVFSSLPTLYSALRVLGGLYLVYLAWGIWRGRHEALAPQEALLGPRSDLRSLMLGFGTQVSNPKTAIVYASVFAAFLTTPPSLAMSAGILVGVTIIESVWYALVALGLSSSRARGSYLRFKATTDTAASMVMGALGVSLVADVLRK